MPPEARANADQTTDFVKVREQGDADQRVVCSLLPPPALLRLGAHRRPRWQASVIGENARHPASLHLHDGKDRAVNPADADERQGGMVGGKDQPVQPGGGARPRLQIGRQEGELQTIAGAEDDAVRIQALAGDGEHSTAFDALDSCANSDITGRDAGEQGITADTWRRGRIERDPCVRPHLRGRLDRAAGVLAAQEALAAARPHRRRQHCRQPGAMMIDRATTHKSGRHPGAAPHAQGHASGSSNQIGGNLDSAAAQANDQDMPAREWLGLAIVKTMNHAPGEGCKARDVREERFPEDAAAHHHGVEVLARRSLGVLEPPWQSGANRARRLRKVQRCLD